MKKLIILLITAVSLAGCKKDKTFEEVKVWATLGTRPATIILEKPDGTQNFTNQTGTFEQKFPGKKGETIKLTVMGTSLLDSYEAGISYDGDVLKRETGNPVVLEVTLK